MSRINRAAIVDGEEIEAAPLNARYADYTQTDINEFNTRDAAIDLPQFKRTGGRGFLCKTATEIRIGKVDFYHDAPVSLAGMNTAPASALVIGDGANPTPMGPLAVGLVSIDTTNVLRIYWSLNVNPKFTGTPWTTTSTPSAKYTLAKNGGGTDVTSTNGTCWVFYLEWDITGPTLANFVPVPGQGDFDTVVTGAIRGELLENTSATSVVPCWTTTFSADDRETTGSEHANVTGWRSVSGTYYYDSSMAGAVGTVYGVRLVCKGPMHPYQTGGRNYLVQQPDIVNQGATNVTLEHTSGRMSLILHKVK